jgi:hypothetical protein
MAAKAEELLGNLWKLNVLDIERTLGAVVDRVLQVRFLLLGARRYPPCVHADVYRGRPTAAWLC